MATTASMSENRVSVCITWDQRQYLLAGANRYRIGFSEYLRRVLDQQIYGETVEVTRLPPND